MDRLVLRCTYENAKKIGCDYFLQQESLPEDCEFPDCEFRASYGYCGYINGYINESSADFLERINRLGELEDELEQREQGCDHCNNNDCDTCDTPYCFDCVDKSEYRPQKYCSFCGRYLVE